MYPILSTLNMHNEEKSLLRCLTVAMPLGIGTKWNAKEAFFSNFKRRIKSTKDKKFLRIYKWMNYYNRL